MTLLADVQEALAHRGIYTTLHTLSRSGATADQCLELGQWASGMGHLSRMPAWFRHVFDRGLARHLSGWCKFCGCQDDRACEGGCGWMDVEHTICSRCVNRVRR